MRMCMDEVMRAAGDDMAVVVKTNMRDGFRGGMEIGECLEVARELERCGAACVGVERRICEPRADVCDARQYADPYVDALYDAVVA